jgi:hypothetical protein
VVAALGRSSTDRRKDRAGDCAVNRADAARAHSGQCGATEASAACRRSKTASGSASSDFVGGSNSVQGADAVNGNSVESAHAGGARRPVGDITTTEYGDSHGQATVDFPGAICGAITRGGENAGPGTAARESNAAADYHAEAAGEFSGAVIRGSENAGSGIPGHKRNAAGDGRPGVADDNATANSGGGSEAVARRAASRTRDTIDRRSAGPAKNTRDAGGCSTTVNSNPCHPGRPAACTARRTGACAGFGRATACPTEASRAAANSV